MSGGTFPHWIFSDNFRFFYIRFLFQGKHTPSLTYSHCGDCCRYPHLSLPMMLMMVMLMVTMMVMMVKMVLMIRRRRSNTPTFTVQMYKGTKVEQQQIKETFGRNFNLSFSPWKFISWWLMERLIIMMITMKLIMTRMLIDNKSWSWKFVHFRGVCCNKSWGCCETGGEHWEVAFIYHSLSLWRGVRKVFSYPCWLNIIAN